MKSGPYHQPLVYLIFLASVIQFFFSAFLFCGRWIPQNNQRQWTIFCKNKKHFEVCGCFCFIDNKNNCKYLWDGGTYGPMNQNCYLTKFNRNTNLQAFYGNSSMLHFLRIGQKGLENCSSKTHLGYLEKNS